MSYKAPGLAKGRVNANSRRYRARKKAEPTLAECPFCGISAPSRDTVALQFKLVSQQLPDDDTTVLLLLNDGEPELAYHADGAWWAAGRELYRIKGEPLAWAHVPNELPGRVQQLAKPLRKQSILAGGVH
jgi:hypothetical protein